MLDVPFSPPYRFGFVIEQTLGNAAYYHMLRSVVDADLRIQPRWYPLAFRPQGTWETLPVLRSNWSVRASLRARRVLAAAGAERHHDALFFHTQVSTLCCVQLMRHVPTVISLDATPLNYDAVGAAYGHRQGGRAVEALKKRINTRALHAADALVTFSDWTRRSLVADYGIDAQRVTVIRPGVDLRSWSWPHTGEESGLPRVLFVGGDFARKGGDVLLQAFRSSLAGRCELHLVTKSPVEPGPGVHVYRNVQPHSAQLRQLYAAADIFVLPSLADCFPHVIQEAMAAGLPVVASRVGAIDEAVRDGETGILVSPGDVEGLRAAMDMLLREGARRRAMGAAGRQIAEREFDSTVNARRLCDLMAELVAARGLRRTVNVPRAPVRAEM